MLKYDGPWKDVEGIKPGTNGQILYGSTYRRYLEKSNS